MRLRNKPTKEEELDGLYRRLISHEAKINRQQLREMSWLGRIWGGAIIAAIILLMAMAMMR